MKSLALFFCFVLLAGCATTEVPQLIVKEYRSRIEPTSPPIQEIRADNPFYSAAADPSLVTFASATDRKLRIRIDNGKWFAVLPGKSKSFSFPVPIGHNDIEKHSAQILIERPTRHYGSWDTGRTFNFYIRLDGSPQTFYLSDR